MRSLKGDGSRVLLDLFIIALQVTEGAANACDQIQLFWLAFKIELQQVQTTTCPLQGIAALVSQAGYHLSDRGQSLGLDEASFGILEFSDVRDQPNLVMVISVSRNAQLTAHPISSNHGQQASILEIGSLHHAILLQALVKAISAKDSKPVANRADFVSRVSSQLLNRPVNEKIVVIDEDRTRG